MRVRLTLAAAAIALIAPFSSPALSQDKLDLAGLLERARLENPELAAMREGALSMEASARAEGSLDDPTLKIEFEDLSAKRPLEIGPGHSMLTRYTLSQMFPFPGKRALKERAAGKEAEAARAMVAAKELEVAALVKGAYFEYAFMDESIRITEGIKELLSTASEIAGTMYSTGRATQQDVIKLNVEQAMLADEVITLEARRLVAAARIKSLVNMDQSNELIGTASLPRERPGLDINKLIEAASSSTPEITALKADAQARELGASLAEKDFYPDFMVGVAPMQREGRFDSYDLMFQVNLPIWRSRLNNLSDGAKAASRAARARLEAGRNKKALDVKSLAIDVEAARRQMELFETIILPQSELSYESALKNYRSGKTDLISLLDTSRGLKRTRIDLLMAIFEYNMKLAELERESGIELLTEVMDEK